MVRVTDSSASDLGSILGTVCKFFGKFYFVELLDDNCEKLDWISLTLDANYNKTIAF